MLLWRSSDETVLQVSDGYFLYDEYFTLLMECCFFLEILIVFGAENMMCPYPLNWIGYL